MVELQRLQAADADTMVEVFGVRSPYDTGHAPAAAAAGADDQSSTTTSEPRLRAAVGCMWSVMSVCNHECG